MEKQVIRSFTGQIVGYYEIDYKGNKTIKDFYGRILGYYEKSGDVTRLFNYTIIARGDVSGIFFKDLIRF